MSHFAVMVIGNNIDKKLAPFHEYECTGVEDEYVIHVNVTREALKNKEHYSDQPMVEFLDDYYSIKEVYDAEPEDAPNTRYAVVKEGQLIAAYKFTNPNAKWDWYLVGGRFSNWLLLKDGEEADSALKGELDIEGMRDAAGAKAAKQYDKVAEGIALGPWESWEAVYSQHEEDVQTARNLYWAQPAVQKIKELCDAWSVDSIDCFQVDRETFIQRGRDRALATYAFLDRNGWKEKGEMGWFGMSDDKFSQDDWNKQMNAAIDALPDDARITIVDCHI